MLRVSGTMLYRCSNCGESYIRSCPDYQRRMRLYGSVWCRDCLAWVGQAQRIERVIHKLT